MNNLGQRAYARLINVSGVKSITFHGLRHTCATLALKAGVPVKVVSERLGHKRIEVTLGDITVSGIISPYFMGHPRQFLALKSFLTPLLSLFGLGGMADVTGTQAIRLGGITKLRSAEYRVNTLEGVGSECVIAHGE